MPEEKEKTKKTRRGILNPKLVRVVSFIIISISLVACTVLCILAIWEFTKTDAVWRAITTFGVISLATAVFAFVNERLG